MMWTWTSDGVAVLGHRTDVVDGARATLRMELCAERLRGQHGVVDEELAVQGLGAWRTRCWGVHGLRGRGAQRGRGHHGVAGSRPMLPTMASSWWLGVEAKARRGRAPGCRARGEGSMRVVGARLVSQPQRLAKDHDVGVAGASGRGRGRHGVAGLGSCSTRRDQRRGGGLAAWSGGLGGRSARAWSSCWGLARGSTGEGDGGGWEWSRERRRPWLL